MIKNSADSDILRLITEKEYKFIFLKREKGIVLEQ